MSFARTYAGAEVNVLHRADIPNTKGIIFGDENDYNNNFVWIKNIINNKDNNNLKFKFRKLEYSINVYYKIDDEDYCIGVRQSSIEIVIRASKDEIDKLIKALDL